MIDDLSRIDSPQMTFYREVYKNSPMWDGSPGKRIVIYCEQGMGDIIMFARYFSKIDGQLILHCPKPLHRLFQQIPNVVEMVDKEEENLPPHDYHVLSLSLPFILGSFEAEEPYLKAESLDVGEGFKIGICWEGNYLYEDNLKRSCHLKYFKEVCKRGKLFMLQDKTHLPPLCEGCEDMDLYSWPLNDFADTARLIQSMDVVASVDSSVLHLAGALGKKTYGLLHSEYDPRWAFRKWYRNTKLIRQPEPGKWGAVFKRLIDLIK